MDLISRDSCRQLGLLSLEEDELWPLARTSRCFCLGCCTNRVRVVVGGGARGEDKAPPPSKSLNGAGGASCRLLMCAAPLSRIRFTPLRPPIHGLRLPLQSDSRSPPLCERQSNNVGALSPPLLSWWGSGVLPIPPRRWRRRYERMRSIVGSCHELFKAFSLLTLEPLVCHFLYLWDPEVWSHHCIPWRGGRSGVTYE